MCHAALLWELHPGWSAPWGARDRLLQQQLQHPAGLSGLVSITGLAGCGRAEPAGRAIPPLRRWEELGPASQTSTLSPDSPPSLPSCPESGHKLVSEGPQVCLPLMLGILSPKVLDFLLPAGPLLQVCMLPASEARLCGHEGGGESSKDRRGHPSRPSPLPPRVVHHDRHRVGQR